MLFEAAYVAEIVRGGLQSVPRGQVEAAQAIGLSPPRVLRLVVLPQALRAVIPAMVGQFISLFKDTSLLSIIGFFELLAVAEVATEQDAFRGQGRPGGHAGLRRPAVLGGLFDHGTREPAARAPPGRGRTMTDTTLPSRAAKEAPDAGAR